MCLLFMSTFLNFVSQMRHTSCFSAQDTPSFPQVLEYEETKTLLIVKPLCEEMMTLSPQFNTNELFRR